MNEKSGGPTHFQHNFLLSKQKNGVIFNFQTYIAEKIPTHFQIS